MAEVDTKYTVMMIIGIWAVVLSVFLIKMTSNIIPEYFTIYGWIGLFVAMIASVTLLSGKMNDFAFLNESGGHPFFKWRYLILVVWVGITLFMIFRYSGAVVAVPQATMGAETKFFGIWTGAVIPAILEDALGGIVVYSMAMLTLIFIIEKMGFNLGKGALIGLILISAFVAGGFITGLHSQAYGEQAIAYGRAMFFFTVQFAIYGLTGFFAPIAHFIHNSAIILFFKYSIVGG